MKKFVLLILVLLVCGCSNKNYEEFNMFYMDTYINVKVYDLEKENRDSVFTEIDNIFIEYDVLCDRYTEYYTINNVYYLNNILENGEAVTIDDKLKDIISYGINAYSITSGKVNIALGNAIDLWRQYRESGEGIPSEEELLALSSNSIFDVVLNDNLYTKYNDVKIDLGAYAKGYVTELVGNKLKELGYNSYLINAGGNVKTGDHYSDGKYKVGIENPNDKFLVYEVVNGNNISVVTSGGYERYYEYNNIRYHHIIDPVTLYPSNYSLGVSVITSDSGLGDILSTYLFLIPIEDGINYINSLDNVEALWYGLDDKIYYSEGYNIYE